MYTSETCLRCQQYVLRNRKQLNLHFTCSFSAVSGLRIQTHEFTVPLALHTPALDPTFTLMSLFFPTGKFLNFFLKIVP